MHSRTVVEQTCRLQEYLSSVCSHPCFNRSFHSTPGSSLPWESSLFGVAARHPSLEFAECENLPADEARQLVIHDKPVSPNHCTRNDTTRVNCSHFSDALQWDCRIPGSPGSPSTCLDPKSNRIDMISFETERLKTQTQARQAIDALTHENRQLYESNKALEDSLQTMKADADFWKSQRAGRVQEMQELAMAAFERCNALETENTELKQAVHTFAAGSPTTTVQQLQKIVVNLTEELMRYRKREGDLKEKENIMRQKVNHNIVKAMRQQTEALKVQRRSLHSKNTNINIQNNNTSNQAMKHVTHDVVSVTPFGATSNLYLNHHGFTAYDSIIPGTLSHLAHHAKFTSPLRA
ncbi:hypothetical protein PHLCEN_2v8722 [Hermanssonia centrifuga]|uniref:Uncharacterized protein n=1 Tax=Hermanssonia centrifuga TaxID=98765 RepID=A0A2R6NT14_9APHY|nr:hypothetical protein PHLCEN_2v8722 [Hermanssonia centrifuga]